MNKINDFGFELVTENELKAQYDESSKIYELIDIIMPLLDSLLSNKNADTIKWPAVKRMNEISSLKNKIKSYDNRIVEPVEELDG